MREPVVILGPHRSGTTLLVELLQRLGFFAGARLERNREPWFFLRRNEWLLRRAGGAWDHPLPVRDLLACPELAEQAFALFRGEVLSKRFTEFTDGDGGRLVGPWGWKDPRNAFTWPIWRRVFPGARLILLRRHGVDVARSLHARATRAGDPFASVLAIRSLGSRLKGALPRLELLGHSFESARCRSLEACFSLWEEYTAEAESVFESYEGAKLALRFEDLAREPRGALAAAAELAELETADSDLREAARAVRSERAFAFAADPAARRLWDQVRSSPWMQRLGYDRSPEERA